MKMNLQKSWIRLVAKPQADGEYSADFFNRKGREVFAKFAKEKLGVLCVIFAPFAVQSFLVPVGLELTFILKTGFQAGDEYSADFFAAKDAKFSHSSQRRAWRALQVNSSAGVQGQFTLRKIRKFA